MKRYFLASVALVAGLAMAATAACVEAVATVRETSWRLRNFVLEGVLTVLQAFGRATDWRDLVQPAVQLVQACAYALKLAKRERPDVHPSWRMCPST